MAPSTPPPPSSVLFAAFTIASTFSLVMSPFTTTMRARTSGDMRVPQAADTPRTIRERKCGRKEVGDLLSVEAPAEEAESPVAEKEHRDGERPGRDNRDRQQDRHEPEDAEPQEIGRVT